MIVRLTANMLSPAGPEAKLSILIFHRVLESFDALNPGDPDAASFDRLLGWLHRSFNVLDLDSAIEKLRLKSLPARAVAITFDDGYRDNFKIALPILQKHRMRATFFIATDFLDGGCMWNDVVIEAIRQCNKPTLDLSPVGLGMYPNNDLKAKYDAIRAIIPSLKYQPQKERLQSAIHIAEIVDARIPDTMMMSSEQVRGMHAAGMVIGAHTLSHPILSAVDDGVAEHEIEQSKNNLERLVDYPVTLFAYPNGKPGKDYSYRHVTMVKNAGYKAAVSTSIGSAVCGDDLFQLPRFTPWDSRELKFGLRLANNMRFRAKAAVTGTQGE